MSQAPCQACGQPIPAHRGADWCSRACRRALRRYGSTLAPTASREDQMATALKRRTTMISMGYPLPERYFQPTSR